MLRAVGDVPVRSPRGRIGYIVLVSVVGGQRIDDRRRHGSQLSPFGLRRVPE
jgi:hypothetical protein